MVSNRSSQPWAITPLSRSVSSTTNSCQIPLALVPSNTDSADAAPEGSGAGAGNASPDPKFVGRKKPSDQPGELRQPGRSLVVEAEVDVTHREAGTGIAHQQHPLAAGADEHQVQVGRERVAE